MSWQYQEEPRVSPAGKNFDMLTILILLFAAEPTYDTKIRKIRELRAEELEAARFERYEEMANIRLERDTEIASITANERADLDSIRTEATQKLQRVLAQQEQCEAEGEAVEATCRTEWNGKIEETRAAYEELKETVREERDVEVEQIRLSMEAEQANITSETTTQYEAIQQSKSQQLVTLKNEREVECAAAGFEEACVDRFDDHIEEARVAMEEEMEHLRLEQVKALQTIESTRTKQVEELEIQRQEKVDALREEWKVSCTEKCTVCRETQEELLEEVHLEYEEQITMKRIHWDNQEKITRNEWKDIIHNTRVQRQSQIDR